MIPSWAAPSTPDAAGSSTFPTAAWSASGLAARRACALPAMCGTSWRWLPSGLATSLTTRALRVGTPSFGTVSDPNRQHPRSVYTDAPGRSRAPIPRRGAAAKIQPMRKSVELGTCYVAKVLRRMPSNPVLEAKARAITLEQWQSYFEDPDWWRSATDSVWVALRLYLRDMVTALPRNLRHDLSEMGRSHRTRTAVGILRALQTLGLGILTIHNGPRSEPPRVDCMYETTPLGLAIWTVLYEGPQCPACGAGWFHPAGETGCIFCHDKGPDGLPRTPRRPPRPDQAANTPPISTEQLAAARCCALCPCHGRLHVVCPDAKPCIGRCGRMTTAFESTAPGYCVHCAADPRWIQLEELM